MFGFGMMEILLIAIVAIIALGPEKLPDAMVKIAKLFGSVKRTINEAKTTIDNELNIQELKDEANKFKAQIEDTKNSLMADTKIDLSLHDILKDDLSTSSQEKEVKEIKEKFAKVNEEKAIKKEEAKAKFTLNNSEEEK